MPTPEITSMVELGTRRCVKGDLVVMPSRSYDAPNRKAGQRFVVVLVGEMFRVQDRLWNLERFIVFQTVILKRDRYVTASQSIRRRIEKQLDAWEAGRHVMLVEEILHTCAKYLTAAHREESEENRAKTLHSLVLRGKLQTVVRCIT